MAITAVKIEGNPVLSDAVLSHVDELTVTALFLFAAVLPFAELAYKKRTIKHTAFDSGFFHTALVQDSSTLWQNTYQ